MYNAFHPLWFGLHTHIVHIGDIIYALGLSLRVCRYLLYRWTVLPYTQLHCSAVHFLVPAWPKICPGNLSITGFGSKSLIVYHGPFDLQNMPWYKMLPKFKVVLTLMTCRGIFSPPLSLRFGMVVLILRSHI